MKEKQLQLAKIKADVLLAMAHPTRVLIVETLSKNELRAGEIAKRIGAERTGVSKHLARMVQAGVLKVRRVGKLLLYRVAIP